MVFAPSASIFLEFLGVYQDLEVQASRNIVNTLKFQKIRSSWRQNHVNTQKCQKMQSFPHYYHPLRPIIWKTLDFLDFLGIYMVLAPSALDFLEFLGIHNVSGGLYLHILVNTQKLQKNSEAEGAKTMQIPKNSKKSKVFQTIRLRAGIRPGVEAGE